MEGRGSCKISRLKGVAGRQTLRQILGDVDAHKRADGMETSGRC